MQQYTTKTKKSNKIHTHTASKTNKFIKKTPYSNEEKKIENILNKYS